MSAAIHPHTGSRAAGTGVDHRPAGPVAAAQPGPEAAELIDQSHRRSQAFGIAAHDEPDFSSPRKGDFSDVLAENRFLFQHAAPVMETLYDQIVNTHSMVLLTSARGMVLHSLGDTDFLEKASRVALTPGMDWSEQSKGTNAVGTALKEEQAVIVHGSQHYLEANKFLTCSCTPIFDPYGQVIGALDVTGDHRSFHQHTLALVRMSAQMIENHMFADIFPKAIRIHFHTRSEFLGTLVEGIAVFSPEGRFISANRSGQFQIGLPFAALKAHTFSSLFGIPISALFELFSGAMPNPKQLVLHNGVAVWCRVKIKAANPWNAGRTMPVTPQQAEEQAATTPSPAARTGAPLLPAMPTPCSSWPPSSGAIARPCPTSRPKRPWKWPTSTPNAAAAEENAMHTLNQQQCALVAGGDGTVEGAAGSAIGKALHGLGSKEGAIGGLISPVGAIIGAIIHFNNNH